MTAKQKDPMACPTDPGEGEMTLKELLSSLKSDVAILEPIVKGIDEGTLSDPCPECRRNALKLFKRRALTVERILSGKHRDAMVLSHGEGGDVIALMAASNQDGPGYLDMMEAGLNLVAAALGGLIEDRDRPESLTDAEREVLRVLGMIKGVAKA